MFTASKSECDKIHSDYPVLNKRWKLMSFIGLSYYLDMLRLKRCYLDDLRRFRGIRDFYVRERFKNEIILKEDINKDPWNRSFKVFTSQPSSFKTLNSFYFCESVVLNTEVYVLTTTVNKLPVYCVDVIKLNK